jgi:hypothetical protein
MTEVPECKPTDAECAAPNRPACRRKERYQPTDADHAAFNQRVQQRKGRPVAPRLNEAEPGNADRARTEVPKSVPKCGLTGAGRAALNGQAQPQQEQPVAPRPDEAGPGDADRAMTEVPNSEPEYEQTDAERAAPNRQPQRQKAQPPAPRFNMVADDRGFRVKLDHPDTIDAHSLLKAALGTADDDFYEGLLSQLCGLVNTDDSYDKISESDLNFLLSIIKSGKPKDELHTLLLFHMAAGSMVQVQALQNFSRIQKRISCIDRDLCDISPFLIEKTTALLKNLSLLQDCTERSINRFARTFCMQLEALERYRRSGEPSTTVHVAPGAQAIVGNVTHAAPQTAPNNAAAAPRALTDQQQSAMPIIGEPDRVPVPVRRRKKSNGHQQPSA